MSKDLFEEIVSLENLELAYKQTQKGKEKYKVAAMKFARDESYNLQELRSELINEAYEFGEYVRFKVYEPKERIIHAPEYRDKIVQIAVNNVIKEVYNRCFIHDSYACIDEKGTHKAVDRVSYFLRKSAWEYGESAYIIKLDIEKYFYTIDRTILKSLISKRIYCKKTLKLLFHVIDSADAIDDIGLPLGNTLSQLFANVYMNELDQYCKRSLSLKYYVRYADDVIAVLPNKEEANKALSLMIRFLKEKLNLEISKDKTKIFPIEQGVNAYGFKIHKTHRLLRNQSKRNIKRKAKKMKNAIVEGRMTIEKAEQILNSWLGHASHGCSFNFIERLIERNPHIYKDHKRVLKINEGVMNSVKKKRESMGVVSL